MDAVLARILIGLMLPIIGYMGARLRNRTLIGCFAGCNVCGICFFLVTLMVLFSGLGHLGEWHGKLAEQRAPPRRASRTFRAATAST